MAARQTFKKHPEEQESMAVSLRLLASSQAEAQRQFAALRRIKDAYSECFGVTSVVRQDELDMPVRQRADSFRSDCSLASLANQDWQEEGTGNTQTESYLMLPVLGDRTLSEYLNLSIGPKTQRYFFGVAKPGSPEFMTRAERLEIALKVVLNLVPLHARGLNHSSIRPDIFRVDRAGHIQITGLFANEAIPNFTAPEVRPGRVDETADLSSDIYSLGLLLSDLFPEEGVAHLERRSEEVYSRTLSHKVSPNPPSKSSPIRPLLVGMLQSNGADRCGLTRVVQVLSKELVQELTQQSVAHFSLIHYSAPQAALLPRANALYQQIIRQIEDLDEQEELGAASALRLIAADLYQAMHNKNEKHLCVETFTDIADRVDTVFDKRLTEVSRLPVKALVSMSRVLADSENAKSASRILAAQKVFQPLLQQLNSEISRLSVGDDKKVTKGQQTLIDL